MKQFTGSYLNESPPPPCPGPFQPTNLSLATCKVVRDNVGMPPDRIALFLLTGSFNAVTIAPVAYVGFPRPETRFTLGGTVLLGYAGLTLAPVVFLPHHLLR